MKAYPAVSNLLGTSRKDYTHLPVVDAQGGRTLKSFLTRRVSPGVRGPTLRVAEIVFPNSAPERRSQLLKFSHLSSFSPGDSIVAREIFSKRGSYLAECAPLVTVFLDVTG